MTEIAYRPLATDTHGLNEEMQWARIIAAGRPAQGMALILIQKLCAVFHEFEPAWRAGALNEGKLDFFRRRLAARARRVLATMAMNDLSHIDGVAQLEALLRTIESVQSMEELANLAEEIHAVDHRLTDALEKS